MGDSNDINAPRQLKPAPESQATGLIQALRPGKVAYANGPFFWKTKFKEVNDHGVSYVLPQVQEKRSS